MITFEQALQIVESSVTPLAAESIPLTRSLNRILAREVHADSDMPPFNKAAMDGFACRKADLGNVLDVVDEIPAGGIPKKTIGDNQCARIMTGAMVPGGADFILMKEHTENVASGRIRRILVSEHENICYKGEDVRAGDIILFPGTRLLPPHLAMLAFVGCVFPIVYRMPAIGVLSTGNELVDPALKPGAGKIRESNGSQLKAQAEQMGLSADYLGIAPDDEDILYGMMVKALEKYEVVLISGGVSVGDYDYVPAVLSRLNVEPLFHGMNVKPGKHLLFGKRKDRYVVGMPGNPVSSLVQFEVLVKPLLNRLMGYTGRPLWLPVPLEETYKRNRHDTLFFIPVDLTEHGTALPLEYHGSAHIHAYIKAKGIMEIPVGVNEIKKGEMVHVRPL